VSFSIIIKIMSMKNIIITFAAVLGVHIADAFTSMEMTVFYFAAYTFLLFALSKRFL